jgi:tripartite-type tricarboxylate transporter receptor subunit TctC
VPRLIQVVTTVALICATAARAADEPAYPAKAVRMIVPFAPGGGADFFGRVLAEKLATRLGQSFVIDNRGGAGGAVGTEVAAKAAPDGYTLVFVSNGYSVSPAVSKVAYDPLKDLAPIARVVDTSMVVAAHPSVPATDLKGLVAYAKENPGKLSFGSSGVGGIAHLATEEFLISAGIKMVHVPYKGTGPANTALIGGEIQVNVGDIGAIVQMIRAGRVKALAVGSQSRSKLLPSVPSAAESGYPDSKFGIWYGLLAPRGTPAAIISRLNREVNAVLATPEVIDTFTARFAVPAGGSPDEFAGNIKADYEFWKRFSDRTGLKVE